MLLLNYLSPSCNLFHLPHNDTIIPIKVLWALVSDKTSTQRNSILGQIPHNPKSIFPPPTVHSLSQGGPSSRTLASDLAHHTKRRPHIAIGGNSFKCECFAYNGIVGHVINWFRRQIAARYPIPIIAANASILCCLAENVC